jgi:hypothetical protein
MLNALPKGLTRDFWPQNRRSKRESDRRNHIRWSVADHSAELAAATYFGLSNSDRHQLVPRGFFPLLRRRKFFVDVGFFEFLRQ